MKKLIFVILLSFIIYNSFPEETDDKSGYTSFQDIRKTIQYGIEKELLIILRQLGKSPRKELYPLLLERYKDASLMDTKIKIVEYFSDCENPTEEIINSIYEDAKKDPSDVKYHSSLLYFIGKKGSSKELQLLIERLDHSNELIKIAAADALSLSTSKDIAKPILERLEISDKNEEKYLSSEVISKLILAFGKMKSNEAVPYLKKILSENASDKYIIMYSMLSLAQIGDEDSIPLIKKNLGNDEIKIQEYSAYSLSLYNAKAVIPALQKMLRNNNDKIRIYACQGIVQNNAIELIPILQFKFTNDSSETVRKEAGMSLMHLGLPGINAIKETMNNKKYSDSDLSILSNAVKIKADEINVSFIVDIYNNSSDKQKEIIARNIVGGDSNKLDPIIKLLLSSKDYLIRIGAIRAVYDIKDSSLWGIIKELSENDPSIIVRKNAKTIFDLKNGI